MMVTEIHKITLVTKDDTMFEVKLKLLNIHLIPLLQYRIKILKEMDMNEYQDILVMLFLHIDKHQDHIHLNIQYRVECIYLFSNTKIDVVHIVLVSFS